MSLEVELIVLLQRFAADVSQSEEQLRTRLARPPYCGSIDSTGESWRFDRESIGSTG